MYYQNNIGSTSIGLKYLNKTIFHLSLDLLANEKLGWRAEKDIEDMCRDAYRFASKKQ